MQEITREEIQTKALAFNHAGEKWHFHVLLPNCTFNKKPLNAFVLEGPDEKYVYYSQDSVSDLGKELAPLAHKADVLNSRATQPGYHPSDMIQKIISRAKELNKEGIRWHHHVTFPGCQYHDGSKGFVLVFEDPITSDLLKSHTEEEPINDLKQIEPLFYSQKFK
jgi:hypothetical protein